MSKPLKDRYPGAALVTGASSGIGEAYARRLAAEKFDLVLVARREDRLQKLRQELEREHRIRILILAEDLGDHSAPERIQRGVSAAGLQISLLVLNAGVGIYGHLKDNPREREISMVDINCRATLDLVHRFLPPMLRQQRGAIVIVASIAAFGAIPYYATYAATKVFDLYLAEALHLELRPQGIDVLGVLPGPTATEFNQLAGYTDKPPFSRSPEQVVATTFRALGRKMSVADGFPNKLNGFLQRFAPRRFAARVAGWVMAPKNPKAVAKSEAPS